MYLREARLSADWSMLYRYPLVGLPAPGYPQGAPVPPGCLSLKPDVPGRFRFKFDAMLPEVGPCACVNMAACEYTEEVKCLAAEFSP